MSHGVNIHFDAKRGTLVAGGNHARSSRDASSGWIQIGHDGIDLVFHGDWHQLRRVLVAALGQVNRLAGHYDQGYQVVDVDALGDYEVAQLAAAVATTCANCGVTIQRLGALGWANTSTGGLKCATGGDHRVAEAAAAVAP